MVFLFYGETTEPFPKTSVFHAQSMLLLELELRRNHMCI